MKSNTIKNIEYWEYKYNNIADCDDYIIYKRNHINHTEECIYDYDGILTGDINTYHNHTIDDERKLYDAYTINVIPEYDIEHSIFLHNI